MPDEVEHFGEDVAPDVDCYTLPNGECVATPCRLHDPSPSGESERGANPEGNALLARFHKGAGTPKAEFAGLMSIAGYASFDEACALWDAAPVEAGERIGSIVPAEKDT